MGGDELVVAEQPHGGLGGGRITLLVSHRFSTVRMADLIVVLDGTRVVEVGSHKELMAAAEQYAELQEIQATAYRYRQQPLLAHVGEVDGTGRGG